MLLSPVVPRLTGIGISMRAGAHVEALSQSFEITLALVRPDEADAVDQIPPELKDRCAEVLVSRQLTLFEQVWRRAEDEHARIVVEVLPRRPFLAARAQRALRDIADQLRGRSFDAVFCFRLHTHEFVHHMRSCGISARCLMLDMDDYESRSRLSYARELRDKLGRLKFALRWLDGIKLRDYERRALPRFNVISVGSELDRAALAARFRTDKFTVVPNVVRAPPTLERRPHERFTFFYIGAMDYPPNADAVEHFCQDILPILRDVAARPFRILIAGRHSRPRLDHLRAHPEVDLVGEVPDVSACYSEADAVIVPLRTGGGTRIKILEALAHRVPVVSTPVGAEGLDLQDGRDVLIGSDERQFAWRCRDLMEVPAMHVRLVSAGHEIWSTRYTTAALVTQMDQIFRDCV